MNVFIAFFNVCSVCVMFLFKFSAQKITPKGTQNNLGPIIKTSEGII